MLIDTVEVELSAGKGGDGIVSWRREKFVPRGGPDGGDGGRGGSVILRASSNLDTLSTFRYRKVFRAEDGENGKSKRMAGSAGKDLELLVPVGTVVTLIGTDKELYDLTKPDQTVKIVHGGKGGLGNIHFSTSTNQAPQESTKGEKGEHCSVTLELRLVADVALIGEPNAGKSSLLKVLTGVEGRIGAYQFSTTEPLLGVLKHGKNRLTLIDLPGILEGAHKGRGLGTQFLRHVKRVHGLLHVVDATHPDIDQSISVINQELASYDPRLANLPRLLVLNKIDLLTKEELTALKKKYPKAIFTTVLAKGRQEELIEAIFSAST
jgi:GTP-binding protein